MKKYVKIIYVINLIFISSALSSCSSNESATEKSATIINNQNCLSVSERKMELITSGEQVGVGMIPLNASAIKSPDFNNVYFIALKFSAPGIENVVGVWASDNLDESGTILSIDYVAQEFTIWPWGSVTNAKISANDPSVEVAKSCLQ